MNINTKSKKILGDVVTPVSIYLKLRDIYPNTLLLESSDYHRGKSSNSFICLMPIASFVVSEKKIKIVMPNSETKEIDIKDGATITEELNNFRKSFICKGDKVSINGIFGYTSFDAVKYFENLELTSKKNDEAQIPEICYYFYKYIISINHFNNSLEIIENLTESENSEIEKIETLINRYNFATYPFKTEDSEKSNMTDETYKSIVSKGKEHCKRGDVFQIVLSRHFDQKFKGDEFNVYRALRTVNPSPYLFYFDFGNYKIFGSSPEAQIEIKDSTAFIHPIAGTFKRTGDDEEDKALAEKLINDKKENSEHIMLVDLARNDLSRNATNVKLVKFKEVQYYSHVLHLVSTVSGELAKDFNPVKVLIDSYPAGTLSGAPKHKAIELIDKYEGLLRGFYGGCIGYYGFNGDTNHAIVIRSFLSMNNTLHYQAGAGIVIDSVEENEKNEVNNKLAALKAALINAEII